MERAAIIDYDYKFSYLDEILFKLGKLNKNKIYKEIIFEEKIIRIIKFPCSPKSLMNKKNFLSIADKFINFLKSNKINKIIFSEEAKKFKNIIEILKYNFETFKGKSIINFKFKYIIRKSFNKDEKSDLVFFSNNIEEFKSYFNLTFKDYRVSALVTEYKNLFISFVDEIFNEYGFLINIYNIDEFKYKKNHFVINIDFSEKHCNYDLDIKKFKIIFFNNRLFELLSEYFKIFDEKVLEFMIYSVYGKIKKSIIKEFLKNYDIKIVKIYKK